MTSPFDPLSLTDLDELLRHFAFPRKIESVLLRLVGASSPAPSAALPAQLRIERDGVLRPAGSWGCLSDQFVIEAVTSDGEPDLALHQQSTVVETLARLRHRFGLSADRARLINGAAEPVPLAEAASLVPLLDLLDKKLADLARRAPAASRDPNFPFPDQVRPIWSLIEKLKSDDATSIIIRKFTQAPTSRELEPPTVAPQSPREVPELTPALMHELRPHVINLTQGRFSSGGDFRTTPEDVDDIFASHLPRWARSRPAGEPLRIVVYAHGGLVSEESGLAIAANHIGWWKDNGVYPLYFVWETGLSETLAQLLNPNRQRALDFAAPTDFLLEELARGIGGGTIWSGMKRSAELASDADGGARYLAGKLAAFCALPEFAQVELHAVGHSAGAIFQSHFIPAALAAGVPAFTSLSLLAPAIRVDAFHQHLAPLIGNGIARVTLFTMARSFELSDHCALVYRKSLLYLIRAALEPERRAAILGLEECLRADPALRRIFNLDGQPGAPGETVFSVTNTTTGRASSTSSSHGGFDNDAPTMNSLARRVLGRDQIKPFVDLSRDALAARSFVSPLLAAQPRPSSVAVVPTPNTTPAASGAKRALCVGINAYPTAPLHGCVADANNWSRALTSLGFTTQLLLDGAATAVAIGDALRTLVRESRPGDTLVFQFAGHGTQVPDVDGDEADDTDEALCPFDFDAGNFLIDDDLGTIFDLIPDGVSVTMFSDCCHSGTITRFALGRPKHRPDQKARFVQVTPAQAEAHRAKRAAVTRAVRSATQPRREVLFSACRDVEVALETAGNGDFTTRTIPLLAAAFGRIDNQQFAAQIVQAFGPSPAQHPELHCVAPLRNVTFLAAPAQSGGGGSAKRAELQQAIALVTQAALSSVP